MIEVIDMRPNTTLYKETTAEMCVLRDISVKHTLCYVSGKEFERVENETYLQLFLEWVMEKMSENRCVNHFTCYVLDFFLKVNSKYEIVGVLPTTSRDFKQAVMLYGPQLEVEAQHGIVFANGYWDVMVKPDKDGFVTRRTFRPKRHAATLKVYEKCVLNRYTLADYTKRYVRYAQQALARQQLELNGFILIKSPGIRGESVFEFQTAYFISLRFDFFYQTLYHF